MILELTPEQAAFKASVEEFAREVVAPRAAAIDETGDYPVDVMRAAGERGLLGVTIPKAWGGGGRDYVSYALAIEAVARASATVAAALSVTNSLVAELIAHAGRAPQKEQWLRQLASGAAIGAFALSEPDAGTDAANQQSRAVKDGDGYRITGRKVWVANADAAAVAIVFAATRPGLRGQGVTAFLVPMDTPGMTRTARADSLGVRGLGCQDLELDITVGEARRCSVRSIKASGSRCGRCRAGASPSPPRRSASAKPRSTKRSRTRSSAKSSASRLRTIRRSSGCWPTWRPSSMRRGC